MLSLFDIIKQLRVSELNYDLGGKINAELLDILLTQIKDAPLSLKVERQSLLSVVQSELDDRALVIPLYNALYVADRIFDVFVRKSPLDSELLLRLSAWRGLFACCLIRNQPLNNQHPLICLLNALARDQLSWTSDNPRVAAKLLKWLESFDEAIRSTTVDKLHEQLKQQWLSYRQMTESVSEQRHKLTMRLIESEKGLAVSRKASHLAATLINSLTHHYQFPPEVIDFIQGDWFRAVRLSLHSDSSDANVEALSKITRQMVWLYRAANEKSKELLYRHSESLIDDLISMFETLELTIDESQINVLQALLVDELKEQAGEKVSVQPLHLDEIGETTAASEAIRQGLKEEHWYLYTECSGKISRLQCLAILAETGEALWVNQTGAKFALMSLASIVDAFKSRALRSLENGPSFEKELENNRRGLEKVVSAQLSVRKRAMEKAKKEAEELRLAEETARLKAEAEALRRKEQAQKLEALAAERLRLEKEDEIYTRLDDLKLGAWLEFERDEGKLQYKLAVKILASEKFIFVDKLGLKRFEIKRDELMREMLDQRCRILNEGAEFADTLSRVVGRIRVGK